MNLTLRVLDGELAILRLPPGTAIPAWLGFSADPLVSVTHTGNELSIICPVAVVPTGLKCEAGWRAMRVEDKLEFSAVGILASILAPLAAAGISILSVSTFDTDYILVRAANLEKAEAVLAQHLILKTQR
jgi:hypothetical protein